MGRRSESTMAVTMFRPVVSCRFFALCAIASLSSSFLLRYVAAWTPSSSPPSPPRSRRSSTGGGGASSAATSSRDDFLRGVAARSSAAVAAAAAAAAAAVLAADPRPSLAAPPFAVMSEELGYFPATDAALNATVMVPASIRRASTDQATSLAEYLRSSGAVFYGAFWCPHCRRQRELFGRGAFEMLAYVECDPRGIHSKFAACAIEGVDGYPTWKFGNGEVRGGEMELVEIAKASGYLKKRGGGSFDASLETGVPPLGGASCR